MYLRNAKLKGRTFLTEKFQKYHFTAFRQKSKKVSVIQTDRSFAKNDDQKYALANFFSLRIISVFEQKIPMLIEKTKLRTLSSLKTLEGVSQRNYIIFSNQCHF